MVYMRSITGRLSVSGIWLALLLVACGGDGAATVGDAGLGPDEGNVGAPCGMLGDGGFGVCASGICLSGPPAYCTATCNQDDDCVGQLRDPADPLDTRCQKGFACGIPFVRGTLCCVRMCVCKDFLGPAGLPTPIACQGGAAATCDQ